MDKTLVERLAGRIERRPDVADNELFCVPMGELRALTAAQEEIERKDAALRFYARENTWRSCTVYMCGHGAINCNAMADKGAKARAALGTQEKK